MAHELELNQNGTAARAVFDDLPWHGTETKPYIALPEECRNVQRFLAAARMDYTVRLQRVATWDDASNGWIETPDQFSLTRSDDGKVVSPRTVSEGYVPRWPAHLGEVFQYWVAEGFIELRSAFTLANGSREILVAEIIGAESPGRRMFLTGRNSHAGEQTDFVLSGVKVVCANTERAAFNSGADLKFRHSESGESRLKQATNLWEKARKAIFSNQQRLNALAETRCEIVPTLDAVLDIQPDASTYAKNRRDKILSRTNVPSMGTHGETLGDIFDATTDYLTHESKFLKSLDKFWSDSVQNFESDVFERLCSIAGV